MNLHPFDEVIDACRKRMGEGWEIHLQFNCAKCGLKQTFAEPNFLSKTGKCEACGHVTSLEDDGCNYMAMLTP